MKTGIYFLIKADEIIYIGQTTQFPIRLKYHKLQKIGYETVKFIECAAEKLDEYERRWIIRFTPKFNVTHNPKLLFIEHDRKKSKVFKRMKFRKLTEKSFIGFGGYKDTTVEKMMQIRKMDLVNIYFCLSHITFFDNILDDLKISAEWRIEKPGTDRNRYYDFCREVYPEWVSDQKNLAGNKHHEASIKRLGILNHNSISKAYNARYNKGKL